MKDGGPAFPRAAFSASDDMINYEGMSLRDYFAGQALIATYLNIVGPSPDERASLCYRMADAMLQARTAGEKP